VNLLFMPRVVKQEARGSASFVGRGFLMGDHLLPGLDYNSTHYGWSDALTRFHEKSAGSNHFIDRASRKYALRQILKHVQGKSPVILEVGSSSGYMVRLMREHLPHATIMGSDVAGEALRRLAAYMPDSPLLRFDLVHCPFSDCTFDAVVLLNVLEHLDDDKTAVKQLYRILKPRGIAVVEVPAGAHLYDAYDEMLLHRRRYNFPELSRLFTDAGFMIQKKSHLGFFLYPFFCAVKKRNRRLFSLGKATIQQIVEQNIRDTRDSRLLNNLMRIELLLGKLISYPIGIRSLLTCVRPM
jgi:ubiquinone/menaquinone biosynthesis C-methylase UbiE